MQASQDLPVSVIVWSNLVFLIALISPVEVLVTHRYPPDDAPALPGKFKNISSSTEEPCGPANSRILFLKTQVESSLILKDGMPLAELTQRTQPKDT